MFRKFWFPDLLFWGFFPIIFCLEIVLTEELGVENEIKHFRSNWELGLEGAVCMSVVSAKWIEEGVEQRSLCFS